MMRRIGRRELAVTIVAAVVAGVWWCCPGPIVPMIPGLTVVVIVTVFVLDAVLWFEDEEDA